MAQLAMASILPYIQIILSLLLIGAILLQRSEAGLGSAFGADGMNMARYSRRGFERILFIGTILIAVLFAVTAFATLFFRS
ncbi:preprotein translocase subunit SecG [Candidatus Parcubacteria bacterium]|nr:preprotein translocase subunit SecG [Candidatus Parcubacteria bacterium]